MENMNSTLCELIARLEDNTRASIVAEGVLAEAKAKYDEAMHNVHALKDEHDDIVTAFQCLCTPVEKTEDTQEPDDLIAVMDESKADNLQDASHGPDPEMMEDPTAIRIKGVRGKEITLVNDQTGEEKTFQTYMEAARFCENMQTGLFSYKVKKGGYIYKLWKEK